MLHKRPIYWSTLNKSKDTKGEDDKRKTTPCLSDWTKRERESCVNAFDFDAFDTLGWTVTKESNKKFCCE
jgi:hypothetical protein